MYLRLASLSLLLLTLFVPPQGDLFRKHYEAANNYHRAGDFAAAEGEFKIILAEAYHRLGKIYLAQNNYQPSVAALEAASVARPKSPDVLVDLAIAYFHTRQYPKAI